MNSEIGSSSGVLFQLLSSDLDASLATADELSREFHSLMKECSSEGEAQPDNGLNSIREKQRTSPKASCPTPTKRDEDINRPLSNTLSPLVTEASPRLPSPLAYDSRSKLSPSPVFSPPSRLTPPQSRKNKLSPSRGLQSPSRQSSSPKSPRRVFLYDSVPRDRVLERRQRIPAEWDENGADKIYGRKPQHAFESTERLRACGSLDSPPSVFSKDSWALQFQPQSSLPRNIRLNPSHPERSSSSSPKPKSPYGSPTVSRKFCAPPSQPQVRWHKPVPLSVIMRAQKPAGIQLTKHPRVMEQEGDRAPHLQHALPPQQLPQPAATEQRQPADRQGSAKQAEREEGDPGAVPRPRSPTRLPALAPEAPGCPELLILRSEIPRALKKRGSLSQPLPLDHRRQYQQMIRKLFSRKRSNQKGELGSESSSSSDGEESLKTPAVALHTPVLVTSQQKGLQSILKQPGWVRGRSRHRAQLSPLVLLLDGALVGELDTVHKAAKQMSDPSQPNEEGVTALHNAICGGHYSIVDFLVQIGANVSTPDSHGWTPLHCAAACNDRSMCEYLVRNGAAVLSVTEGDGATAVEKCDPYAAGFEECTSFLRGVEEAMGVENSGVLYALWGYPAQAPDELSFKEGDTVTIKKKQEGAEWWWASLGNREGFVPNNYFSLFPKVRPRSLLDQNQKGR